MDFQSAVLIHFFCLTFFFFFLMEKEVGGRVQTGREYCVNTVVVRGRLKGYIQTFGGSGGQLPACQASLWKGEEFVIVFKAARWRNYFSLQTVFLGLVASMRGTCRLRL